MGHKTNIHNLIKQMSIEIFDFIKQEEPKFRDRWVPSAHIKNSLELDFVAVPKANKQYGQKGWLFAIIARILEDQGQVRYQKVNGRAYYRTP